VGSIEANHFEQPQKKCCFTKFITISGFLYLLDCALRIHKTLKLDPRCLGRVIPGGMKVQVGCLWG